MSDSFHKFPRTPHLLWLGESSPRADKVLSRAEAEEFLQPEVVVVEEKVDGANLGLSIGPDGRIRAQSRGAYLKPGHSHAQWKPLWLWLARREELLIMGLGRELMLFGEWCYARHTIAYEALPDWFLAFDVLDLKRHTFWSTDRRDALAGRLEISTIPSVCHGRLTLRQLPNLITSSSLGFQRMEGIYLRRESNGQLSARAKIVSPEFCQQIQTHWSRRPLIPNQLTIAHTLSCLG